MGWQLGQYIYFMDNNKLNMEQLLEDLKDFYVWKAYANDNNFISNYLKNRDKTLANVPRSRMSK